ncbi:MAG TPA: penicillin-binding transpeptidase domain-containing protein [Chitinophagaceae bacterium]|jgi:beta-lactamase class D|nr:penicillin-binding transpeptidase domain-containing protein [Chitinophagaceae bacterium]
MKLSFRCFLVLLFASLMFSCSTNNVHVRKEWKKYFAGNGVTGSFMLHNTGLNTFEIYNLGGTQQRFMPVGTFDIMNALTGLETGVISDTNMVIKDSLGHPVDGVNPDLTMGEAFRRSDVPYFQEVARRVGSTKMQFWIDSVKYGNETMGARIDSFWMDNTLKLSVDEQVGLLQGLYTGKLPFQPRTQTLVKSLMFRKKGPDYTMSYHAGAGFVGDQKVGWVVGWIEKGARPHFFALNMETPDSTKDLKALGFKIVHDILNDAGYFK